MNNVSPKKEPTGTNKDLSKVSESAQQLTGTGANTLVRPSLPHSIDQTATESNEEEEEQKTKPVTTASPAIKVHDATPSKKQPQA